MLVANLLWGRTASLITAAFARCPAGSVAVVDLPALATVLADRGLPAVLVTTTPGAARGGFRGTVVAAHDHGLPFDDGALAGVVARDADETQLAAWTAAIATGGVVALFARDSSGESTRRVLCAGLIEPEQRRAAGLTVTSAKVWRRA